MPPILPLQRTAFRLPPALSNSSILIGKVAARTPGYFNVSSPEGVVQGVCYKRCLVIHGADGFSYQLQTGAPLGNALSSISALEVS